MFGAAAKTIPSASFQLGPGCTAICFAANNLNLRVTHEVGGLLEGVTGAT